MKKYLLLILSLSFRCWSYAQSAPLETVVQRGHSKQVTCTAISPNGKYLATGSMDNSIKLWSISNGKEIRTFSEHTAQVNSLQFSPDGKWLLSASPDNHIFIYDIVTGAIVRTFTIEDDILISAYFSKKGTEIIAANGRDKMWVWTVESNVLNGTYTKSYQVKINDSWLHPDGNRVLASLNYKTSRLIGFRNAVSDTITIEFDKTADVSFSPDGKKVALGSTKLFSEIFDVETGKRLFRLENDPDKQCDGCNTRVRFSNTGKYLGSGTAKTGLHLWNPSNGKLIHTFDLEDMRVEQILFSPDDRYIMVSNRDQLLIFDLRNMKLHFKAKSEWLNKFTPMFTPDSQHLILAGDRHTTEFWSLNTRKKTHAFSGFLNRNRDDGLRFSETNWTDEKMLKLIELKTSVALSPDGNYFAKGNLDSSVVMIDLRTGKTIHQFNGHSKVVYTYDFSPDGKKLVTGGGDSFLKVWDTETGKSLFTLPGHREIVFDVKFSSDGKYIVSGAWDGTIILWDAEKGTKIRRISAGQASPYVLNFTPNNLYLAVSDVNKSLKLLELDSGEEFRTLVGHTNQVSAIAYSPDGKSMLTAGWDGKAKVWDLLTGMIQQKFEGHTGKVCAAVWHPEQNRVFTAGSDRKIHIWNPISGKIEASLTGHSSTITSLQVTRDGNTLISCSKDGIVKVWNLTALKEWYTYIRIDRTNWLAKTSSGYFDGTAKSLQLVNYVSGLEVVPIGSLFEKYYTPGLLRRVMTGEKMNDTGYNLQDAIKSAPLVKLTLTDLNSRTVSIEQDSVYLAREKSIPLNVAVSGEKSSGYEVRIYNNSKLVRQDDLSNEIVFRGGGERSSKTFTIDLISGDNDLSVVVINSERVESAPVHLKVNYDGERALPDLYILSIGINDYKNPGYHLEYAVNDANALHKTLRKGTKELFNNVFEFEIRNQQANKTQITALINQIAGEIGPEDVFLFYYAGHGVFDIEPGSEPEFYLVTYDVTNLYGDSEAIRAKAISAKELLDFSKKINAQKQVFVLDACQSGGAVKAFAQRGAGREKALAQLARSSGTFFLTASQDSQFANEAGKLNHGLFTYAILEALSGQAPDLNTDQKVTVNELKGYVEERVAELSKEHHGTAQYPTSYSYGQDFPLVMVK